MDIILTKSLNDFKPTNEANFLAFADVEYKQYLELVELCKNNNLVMIIKFPQTEE